MKFVKKLAEQFCGFIWGFITCLFGTVMFVTSKGSINNEKSFFNEKTINAEACKKQKMAQEQIKTSSPGDVISCYEGALSAIAEGVKRFDSFARAKQRELEQLLSANYDCDGQDCIY